MSGYLVSPGGERRFSQWNCYRCEFGGFGINADAAYRQAADHVRETGHVAAVETGTRELLDSMTGGQS